MRENPLLKVVQEWSVSGWTIESRQQCFNLLFIFANTVELVHVLRSSQHFHKIFVVSDDDELKILLTRSSLYEPMYVKVR